MCCIYKKRFHTNKQILIGGLSLRISVFTVQSFVFNYQFIFNLLYSIINSFSEITKWYYSIINSLFGELWFPYHMPFAYDPTPYAFTDNGTPRYWGNPHEDLEGVFQENLDGFQEDEAPGLYENYTQGPSMYYNTMGMVDITAERRFSILIRNTCE